MRAVAERSVQQAKVAFQQLVHAAQEAVSLEERGDTSQVGALDTSKKAMTSAERNVLSAFEFAQKIVQTKDIQKLVRMQTGSACHSGAMACSQKSRRRRAELFGAAPDDFYNYARGLYRFFRRLFSLRTTRPSWAPQGSRSSSLPLRLAECCRSAPAVGGC